MRPKDIIERIVMIEERERKAPQRGGSGDAARTASAAGRKDARRGSSRARRKAASAAGAAIQATPGTPPAVARTVTATGPMAMPRFPPTEKMLIPVARRSPEA